jgi:hypothetical protein
MNYREKYIKYKTKYNSLKKQLGGNIFETLIMQIINFIRTYNSQQYDRLITGLNQTISNFLKGKGKSIEDFQTYINDSESNIKILSAFASKPGIKYENLIIKLDSKKNCNEEEFRLAPNPFELCNNYNEFKGQCSAPSIEDVHKDSQFLSQELSDKLIQFLHTIKTKFEGNYEKVTIGIHVGGNSYCDLPQLTKSQYNFNLKFEPSEQSYSSDTVNEVDKLMTKIILLDLQSVEPVTYEVKLKASFPLHTNNIYDLQFYNQLKEVTNYVYVNFINAMCLSTFQTFYKLKTFSNKTKFSFISCPQQNDQDKDETTHNRNVTEILNKYK